MKNKNVVLSICLVAILFVSNFAMAQGQRHGGQGGNAERMEALSKMSPEEKTQKHLEKLTSSLNLTKDQQDQIKPILAEMHQKAEDQKAASKQKMRENRREGRKAAKKNAEEMKEKVNAVLTKEQADKWKEMQEQAKAKMKEQRNK